jgi:hypothetical protein
MQDANDSLPVFRARNRCDSYVPRPTGALALTTVKIEWEGEWGDVLAECLRGTEGGCTAEG